MNKLDINEINKYSLNKNFIMNILNNIIILVKIKLMNAQKIK